MTASLLEILQVDMELLYLLEGRLANTIVSILLLWLLHELSLKFLTRRKYASARSEYFYRKGVSYGIIIIGIFIVGRVWFAGFQNVGTVLGLASAGIAIALKDPIVNFAGWIYILWERQFTVGDRIQIGEHKGDVVDQEFLHFTIMEIGNWIEGDQSTGRLIFVPNGKVFHEPLSNYSEDYPYLWDELSVRITFESNWERAKELMLEVLKDEAKKIDKDAAKALREASHRFMILNSTESLEPHVYTEVGDFGIHLHAHYAVEHRQRRQTNHAIWEKILVKFNAENDISFAYPTTRVFNRKFEGKGGDTLGMLGA